MRFSTLALTVFATLALAHDGEAHDHDISVKTVTSTSTHLSVVTSTGKPTTTTEAEEKEPTVLYRVTETPSDLIAALNATTTVAVVKETSSAGNFTLQPTETKTKTEEGAPIETEDTEGGKSAAGRREVGWGVMVGAGLVGAVIMGF